MRSQYCRPIAVLCVLAGGIMPAIAGDDAASPVAETVTRGTFTMPHDKPVPYLVHEPKTMVAPDQRALIVFLHGAGGSLENYNLTRAPFAPIRAAFSERGWHVLVPDLGGRHFMNEDAKAKLDALLPHVLEQLDIPASRVHLMGVSMGGGGALAYAVHRPDAIRSVCAIMPMTDYAAWATENPKYREQLAAAYGGTVAEAPDAYRHNSATENIDAFADISVMLLHGDADEIVLPTHSRKLAEGLTERGYRCVLHLAPGLKHSSSVINTRQVEIVDFIATSMPDRSAR